MAGRGPVIVPLETVTPLFLAGAEARGKPELRPPSFRGALRYWLRAALGGALGDDLDEVRRAEAEVFGNTRAAGAVTVRIRHDQEPVSDTYDRGKGMTGHGYLYWSMAESSRSRPDRYQKPKEFIVPNTRFELVLAARPGALRSPAALLEATAALWLLVQFGGVGSRARRTGGSLSARGTIEAGDLRFQLTGREPTDIRAELGQGLRRVREIVAEGGQAPVTGTPSFDLLHPDACRVWMLGQWPDPREAVNAIGAALRDFRNGQLQTRGAGRTPSRPSMPSLAERTIFGLPLPTRDPRWDVIEATAPGQEINRRASPLWLTVSTTATGQAIGVATLFRSRFLPNGAQLRGKTGRQEDPPADYTLIEQWVRAAFPDAAEVDYA